MVNSAKIKVAIVDDHRLFRSGLAKLINSSGDKFVVSLESDSGINFIKQWGNLDPADLPDLILLDIRMPQMDGFETANWLIERHPDAKIIIVSMLDDDESIIRMFRIGVRAYLSKDTDGAELIFAMNEVISSGFYYSKFSASRIVNSLRSQSIQDSNSASDYLNEREISFLKLVSSELTYKQIADTMGLSARTIDGYRDALFDKLHVKTRVGLVLAAIRLGVVGGNQIV